MTQIVPCRMCKGREDVEPPLLVKGHYYWVFCKTPNCGVEGPLSMANAEAIARWNELMQPSPQASPEPKAGTVRVPVRIAYAASSIGSWPFVLASDGTMWGMPDGMHDKGEWKQLPNLPEPTEIPATVEASDD